MDNITLKHRHVFFTADDADVSRYRDILARMARKGKVYYARLETGEILYVAEEAAYADLDGRLLPGLREMKI